MSKIAGVSTAVFVVTILLVVAGLMWTYGPSHQRASGYDDVQVHTTCYKGIVYLTSPFGGQWYATGVLIDPTTMQPQRCN